MSFRVRPVVERVPVDGRLRRHGTAFAAFVAVYAFMLRDVRIGRLYTFGDFPPYYGVEALRKFASIWHDGGLGYSYIYHVLPGYLGVITTVGDLLFAVVPGVDGGALAQNLFYLSLLPVGYVGFVLFARRYVESVPALHLAAAVYVLNPAIVAEFVNGGIAAIIGFAGLPYVLHFLWRVVERNSWRAALLAGAAFGASTMVPWANFWMVSPFATYLLYRSRDDWGPVIKLFAAGTIGLGLTLPSLHHILQRADRFESAGWALRGTLTWNYSEASLLPVLRLAGNKGAIAMNVLGYNVEGAHLAGLVIPAVALVAWHRKRLHWLFAVVAAIVAFLVATHLGYTYPLFDAVPILYSVRNPSKLQFPMALAVAVLFGAGVETLLARGRPYLERLWRLTDVSPGRRRTFATLSVVGLLVLPLFAYAAPASGALGLEAVRGDDYYVPADQQAVAERLDGRVLWVPYGYTTQLKLRHTYPNHVGIKSGGFLHGIQNTEHVSKLFQDFVDDPGSVRGQLESMGVEYVVVSRDPSDRVANGKPRAVMLYGAPWLKGDPAAYEAAIRESSIYEKSFETDDYAVYRVVGVDETPRVERSRGVNAVYYPRSVARYPAPGKNYLANPDFEKALAGWWAGGANTRYRVVRTGDGFGERGVRLLVDDQPASPLAQDLRITGDGPLVVDVDAEGRVAVDVRWYDGEVAEANFTSHEEFDGDSLPAAVSPNGSHVSVRIRPVNDAAVVRSASLRPGLYPPETGFVGNTEGIPGVAVDGWGRNESVGTRVAVNVPAWKADELGIDVRLYDAESYLGGVLVYDDRFRQGVGVALPDGQIPDAVPDDARVVTREGPNGTTVLDYWVVGEFDDRSVTVLRTSYDDRWRAPDAADHLRADGWANAYVGASPSDVAWTGGRVRIGIVALWALLWVGVLGAIGYLTFRPRSG